MQIVKALSKESGIGVNAINVEGLTALDISKQRDVGNREEIKEMLTRAGALNAVSVSERLYSSEHYFREGERFLATLVNN